MKDTETKYVILVPSKHQKKRLEEALEYLHGLDGIDFGRDDGGTVNQLVHEYLTPKRAGVRSWKQRIVVNKKAYEKAKKPI